MQTPAVDRLLILSEGADIAPLAAASAGLAWAAARHDHRPVTAGRIAAAHLAAVFAIRLAQVSPGEQRRRRPGRHRDVGNCADDRRGSPRPGTRRTMDQPQDGNPGILDSGHREGAASRTVRASENRDRPHAEKIPPDFDAARTTRRSAPVRNGQGGFSQHAWTIMRDVCSSVEETCSGRNLSIAIKGGPSPSKGWNGARCAANHQPIPSGRRHSEVEEKRCSWRPRHYSLWWIFFSLFSNELHLPQQRSILIRRPCVRHIEG